MLVRHEFKPDQKLPWFPSARNFTLNDQYWFVPGKDLRTIYITRISLSNENELPVL